MLALPPPAVVEMSASIVPADFPHANEYSVRESPRLLDRAYVTHPGASEELKGSPSSVRLAICRWKVQRLTKTRLKCRKPYKTGYPSQGIGYYHRSLRKHCNCPDIVSGHSIPRTGQVVQSRNSCMTPDMSRETLYGQERRAKQEDLENSALLTCISTNVAARRDVSPREYFLAVDFRPWSYLRRREIDSIHHSPCRV